MWIFQIARFFRNVFRLIAIFFIILKHIVKNWMYNTWMRRIFDPKGKRLTTRAEQLRQTIEELGPTFVKFGQIVADRPDLASDHRTSLFRGFKNWRKSGYKNSTAQYQT